MDGLRVADIGANTSVSARPPHLDRRIGQPAHFQARSSIRRSCTADGIRYKLAWKCIFLIDVCRTPYTFPSTSHVQIDCTVLMLAHAGNRCALLLGHSCTTDTMQRCFSAFHLLQRRRPPLAGREVCVYSKWPKCFVSEALAPLQEEWEGLPHRTRER